jgi:hypothetical protein
MGAPTSEVGYTIATTRRENHEVHKNKWWEKKKITFASVGELKILRISRCTVCM